MVLNTSRSHIDFSIEIFKMLAQKGSSGPESQGRFLFIEKI